MRQKGDACREVGTIFVYGTRFVTMKQLISFILLCFLALYTLAMPHLRRVCQGHGLMEEDGKCHCMAPWTSNDGMSFCNMDNCEFCVGTNCRATRVSDGGGCGLLRAID
jgi:hypothetical protein